VTRIVVKGPWGGFQCDMQALHVSDLRPAAVSGLRPTQKAPGSVYGTHHSVWTPEESRLMDGDTNEDTSSAFETWPTGSDRDMSEEPSSLAFETWPTGNDGMNRSVRLSPQPRGPQPPAAPSPRPGGGRRLLLSARPPPVR
jgi:hypothetical protein